MPIDRTRVFIAEFIGTFALTFVGVLSISADLVVGPAGSTAPLITAAFAHGLILAVMIAAVGHISGGHINPAVTLGFVVSGRMSPVTGAIYWAAQLAGAVVAGYLLSFMAGIDATAAGTPAVAENVGTGMGIILEAIATFFLVFVVFGTAVDERAPKSVYPFAIGLTLAASIMAIGALTGGALNPARAFGPALATSEFERHYVYWVGPLIGGAIAGLLQLFLMARAPSPAVAERGGPAPSEMRH